MSPRPFRLPFVCVALGLGVVACGDAPAVVAAPPTEPSTMVFVDEAAPAGGDGSAERPFQTLREAFEVDRPIEVIAVAGGRYPAPANFHFSAALTILAYTEAATTIEAEPPAERLVWEPAPEGALVLRDLALASPLELQGGEVELRQLGISNVTAPALHLVDATTVAFGLEVLHVLPDGAEPPGGDGVVVEGGSLQWMGGMVDDVPDRALLLVGTTAEVDAVTLASRSRAALTVTEGSEVTARTVHIEDVSIAVHVNGAALTLDEAFVRNAGTAGLLAAGGSQSTVTDSTFLDCPNGHLSVLGEGSALTATGNTLRGAALTACVFVSSTDGAIVVRDNTVEGCAGTGIALTSVTDGTVEGNEVHDILPDPMFPELADGISTLSSVVRIAGNRVYDTPGYAIVAYRSVAVIDANDVGPTESAAIGVVDPGAAPSTVVGNTIAQARGAGVLVLNADAIVTSNAISGSRHNAEDGFGDGVAFGMGATVTAQTNVITSCAHNGIVFLDGAAGSISDNEATGNGGYGILELCTGEPNTVTVGDNVLTGNTLGEQSLCAE